MEIDNQKLIKKVAKDTEGTFNSKVKTTGRPFQCKTRKTDNFKDKH